jgi:hypothetical protein
MTEAVRAGDLDRDDEDETLRHFTSTATMVVNALSKTPMQAPSLRRPSGFDG